MKPMKLAVLVSGGGTNLQAIIDAIADGTITNSEIVTVISNNPGVKALERAAKAGIPAEVLQPKSYPDRAAFNRALEERIAESGAELIVLAGCLLTIPAELIRAYPNRIVNIHPALIPSFCGKGYYGLKVHEAALKRGVKLSGATVHFVNEDLDAGPIILQKAVEVLPDDTPEILQRRIMEEAEWKLLPEAVRLFCEDRLEVNGRTVIVKE